ncbi:MAG: carotenoid oxygenase family protein [Candidatus Microthrix parvicella]|jgi:carotenoid cleavage dioxygenase-like enzyme
MAPADAPSVANLASTVTNAANQPDLRGNLMPVRSEIDIDGCHVDGTIPTGLRGSFIRNGPNPAFEPLGSYHMFDGDGMLHGITFGDDGVSYRNRWIRSRGLGAELAHGAAVYHGLAEVMSFPDPKHTGDAGPLKNPANTHIIEHAGRRLALWEGGPPTEVDTNLDTLGEYDFGGRLVGAMTAHPRIDPRTGEMCFFSYSLFEPYLRYHVADSTGALVHSVDLDLPAPVMMHDFIITEEHAVFLDSPIVFDLENLGTGPMVNWKPENGTRIGVMPRRGTNADLRWFEIEPGHVQHFWNGWATGNRIEFSGSRLADPNFGIDPTSPLDEQAADNQPGRPARYWVDLDSGSAGWEPSDDLPGDFCRINDAYTGVPNRYAYMSAFGGSVGNQGDFDTMVAYDQSTGERSMWHSGAGGHVGESVFAPDPAGTAENDGWLINAVYYEGGDRTDVCVLDARDVEAGPIARVTMPQRIPFGFHANWFGA